MKTAFAAEGVAERAVGLLLDEIRDTLDMKKHELISLSRAGIFWYNAFRIQHKE